ncbi:hypothetical protein Ancab_037218 [Ancistrocladus abbreviatus]
MSKSFHYNYIYCPIQRTDLNKTLAKLSSPVTEKLIIPLMEDLGHCESSRFLHQQFKPPVQTNPVNRGKSSSRFLFKILLAVLFLSLFPLFPSEAPDFIANTMFAKSWELLHLLLIGIAVSYGLFGRRRAETRTEVNSRTEHLQACMPSLLHQPSSIFDEIPGGYDGSSRIQAWDFPYYRTEPMIVAEEEDYGFDHTPLGLPIRSLRSQVVDSDSEECIDQNESDSSSDSTNVDENLKENMVYSSPIHWKSRSMRMDFKEFGNVSPPIDENYESEQLNSRSFRQPKMGSSKHDEPISSWPNGFSPLCSFLPESPTTEMENSWRNKGFHVPSSPNPPSLSTKANSSASASECNGSSPSNTENYESELLKSRSFTQLKMELSRNDKPVSYSPHGVSALYSFFQDSTTTNFENSWRVNSVDMPSPTLPSAATQANSSASTTESQGSSSTNTVNNESELHKSRSFRQLRMGSFGNKKALSSLPNEVSPVSSCLPESPTTKMENLWREDGFQSPSPTLISQTSPGQASVSKVESSGRSPKLPANQSDDHDSSLIASNTTGIILSPEPTTTMLNNGSPSNKDRQHPPPGIETSKTISRSSHSRRFSCASFFDRDPRKSLKDDLKEINRKSAGETGGGGKCGGWDCLKLEVKPTLTKAALRGKSVRTIRPREIAVETNSMSELTERRKNDGKEEDELSKKEVVIISIGISEKGKQPHPKHENEMGAKEEGNKESFRTRGSQQSSKAAAPAPATNSEANEENGNAEIDKKAGEFIAKFKEQIRLEKVAGRAESSSRRKSLW